MKTQFLLASHLFSIFEKCVLVSVYVSDQKKIKNIQVTKTSNTETKTTSNSDGINSFITIESKFINNNRFYPKKQMSSWYHNDRFAKEMYALQYNIQVLHTVEVNVYWLDEWRLQKAKYRPSIFLLFIGTII